MLSEDLLKLKILLVGDVQAGKSCLLEAFNSEDDRMDTKPYEATMGVEYGQKRVDVAGCSVKLQIWDAGGDPQWRSVIATYYKDTKIVLLTFDITKKETFDNLGSWLAGVKERSLEAQFILVGTKSDLADERQVSEEEARFWALQNLGDQYAYVEVSAREPQKLQARLIGVMTPILEKVISAQKGSSPSPQGGGTPVIEVINTSSTARPFSFFPSGTSSSAPVRTAEDYLTSAANANSHFSDDFRHIFTSLFGIMSTRTPVAQAVFGNDGPLRTLSQRELSQHAEEKPNSRTAQTIAILANVTRLREQLSLTSLPRKKNFLRNFKEAYEQDYSSGIFGSTFSTSAAAVSWIRTITDIGITALSEQAAELHISKILCHAAMNPSSRTARIVENQLIVASTSGSSAVFYSDNDNNSNDDTSRNASSP